MPIEELGKQVAAATPANLETIQVDVHSSKFPSKHVRKNSPNSSRKLSPNNSKRSNSNSPSKSRQTSTISPKSHRRSRDSSPKTMTANDGSAKKIKSSLKHTSRSLSIENPTCVECYLSGKTDKGG